MLDIHTSFLKQKSTKGIKKLINDEFCQLNSNGEFNTTLLPSDSSVQGSMIYYKKIFYPESKLN